MNETEQLYLLRFRYGRTVEIFIAYKTFLNRQVKTDENSYCHNDEIVKQITHTLLLTFYSFVYSLFDKSGTDFISTTDYYVESLTEEGVKFREELIQIWNKNKVAISKLRNNIGFHGGLKLKSHDVGYSALSEFHPFTSELIINQLALFFMEMDKIIPPTEDYKFHVSPKDRALLIKKAEDLKQRINDKSLDNVIIALRKLYGS